MSRWSNNHPSIKSIIFLPSITTCSHESRPHWFPVDSLEHLVSKIFINYIIGRRLQVIATRSHGYFDFLTYICKYTSCRSDWYKGAKKNTLLNGILSYTVAKHALTVCMIVRNLLVRKADSYGPLRNKVNFFNFFLSFLFLSLTVFAVFLKLEWKK